MLKWNLFWICSFRLFQWEKWEIPIHFIRKNLLGLQKLKSKYEVTFFSNKNRWLIDIDKNKSNPSSYLFTHYFTNHLEIISLFISKAIYTWKKKKKSESWNKISLLITNIMNVTVFQKIHFEFKLLYIFVSEVNYYFFYSIINQI